MCRIVRNAVAALLISVIAACSGADDFLETPIPDQTLLSITANGVGPIDGTTPFSKEGIEAKLPGYEARSIQSAVEDGTVWVFAAFSDGKQVIQLFKGKAGRVGAVHGVTQYLLGPAGERIGMSFNDIGPATGDCRMARNLWAGMVICPSRGAGNVALVFSIPEYEGASGKLPPAELLDKATLQRIIWKPIGGAA